MATIAVSGLIYLCFTELNESIIALMEYAKDEPLMITTLFMPIVLIICLSIESFRVINNKYNKK